jgi:predicted HTH transcriptional regulator
MSENQTIEYKSVCKDEYLRWICGFANVQGGTLVIGKDYEAFETAFIFKHVNRN